MITSSLLHILQFRGNLIVPTQKGDIYNFDGTMYELTFIYDKAHVHLFDMLMP